MFSGGLLDQSIDRRTPDTQTTRHLTRIASVEQRQYLLAEQLTLSERSAADVALLALELRTDCGLQFAALVFDLRELCKDVLEDPIDEIGVLLDELV